MYLVMTTLEKYPAMIITFLFCLMVPLVWSSYRLLEIDLAAGRYSTIRWIMGHRRQKTYALPAVRSIVIQHDGTCAFPGKGNFKAFIRCEDDTRIFLATHDIKSTLHERVAPVAKKLGVELTD